MNLNSRPTYFMTLKDNEGLIKKYAYVSVEDYQTVGVGDTIDEACLSYEKALRAGGSTMVGNVNSELSSLSGTVQRIGSEYNSSGSTYYLVLNEHPELLFSVQGSLSAELAITQPGDKVKVEYYPCTSQAQELTSFDNLEFEQSVE